MLWSSRWMLARWRGRGGRRGSPSSSWEGSLQGAPHPRMDKLVITRSEPPSPIRLSRSQGRKVLWPMTPVGSRRVHHCGLCPDTLTDHPLDYRGLWGPTSWQATLADGPARNRTVCSSRALSPSSSAAFGRARVSAGHPGAPHDGATEADLLAFKRRDERRQGGEDEDRGGGRGACRRHCDFLSRPRGLLPPTASHS